MRTVHPLVGILAGLTILVFSIAVNLSVWNECRAGGNSVFYCIKLIGR